MTDFRIVRTIGDIQDLEPGTVLVDHHRVWSVETYLSQAGRAPRNQRVTPMAVVASGELMREAVQAINREITLELNKVRQEYGAGKSPSSKQGEKK